ncbi:MAG: hypothetical protein JWQ03_3233 [Variovorax sp.]|nr:hypothetical protein [Variovorax sp.]
MTERQDHVDARFAGQQIRFELKRDATTQQMMTLCGLAPFAMYRRFAEGLWAADDIMRVLSLAYSPAPYIIVPSIAKRVRSAAYGHYAPLAIAVLEAHLYGIDPDRALFEDTQP